MLTHMNYIFMPDDTDYDGIWWVNVYMTNHGIAVYGCINQLDWSYYADPGICYRIKVTFK